ncbi:regulatory protein RecX [Leucobacter insecticola]|uniref:regulatory protein RecX n=1 Tax=Leucobacter insecticola TaxID=2714934 RepID=UPI00197F8300|nr:regulatory protein RecX [Leucobacter insecticola]
MTAGGSPAEREAGPEPATPRRAVAEVPAGAEVLRGVFPASQIQQSSQNPQTLQTPKTPQTLQTPQTAPEAAEDSGPERSANEDGVRLLARKAKSSGELRHDLLLLGHDPAAVDTVIAEFEQSLYLDDVGLARFLTEKLRDAKRASKSQIRVKLRERKLSDAAIDTALAELDDDEELALLRQTAADRARSMRDLDRQTAERRLLGFLARRGWSGEHATRAVRDALDGNGSRGAFGGASGGVRFR